MSALTRESPNMRRTLAEAFISPSIFISRLNIRKSTITGIISVAGLAAIELISVRE